MEGWFRILFLKALLGTCACMLALPAYPADAPAQSDDQVIKPRIERREITEADIDTENYEVGVFAGMMSVEDFGVNPVFGARFAYHVTEDIFAEAAVGTTKVGRTSFERLSGGAQILTDDERQLTYYNISVGYNILPGEAFFGSKRAFNTDLYLIAGIGSTHFAKDDRFTINFGAGYRFLLNDSVALHLDVRDHVFDMDLLGESKTSHNLETHAGVTFFF
jgi:outer membrane beta-barrel protein